MATTRVLQLGLPQSADYNKYLDVGEHGNWVGDARVAARGNRGGAACVAARVAVKTG